MLEHHLKTERTARYYTLGELNSSTREVWIVLHGYAQLASDFIQNFKALNDGHRYIVAPEALSRFYSRGFAGPPAASWMTKEDRENEIRDYIQYLNTLFTMLQTDKAGAKLVVLGFSQGVATASRWLANSAIKVDRFVIYAGEIAAELREPLHPKMIETEIVYVTGNKDPLITAEKHTAYFELMDRLEATTIEFEGGHEVKSEVLLKLANILFAQ